MLVEMLLEQNMSQRDFHSSESIVRTVRGGKKEERKTKIVVFIYFINENDRTLCLSPFEC